ncbi:MAG: NADH:ubiquinone oxidoreductase subunit J [Pelagibacteraceae bacterium]|nr:NADH:ubiquinone oxidoreductase subunit J [Pelagibacteraceae bacterium]
MLTIFLFFIVSILIITSSLLVITSKNPIHSVLFLILVFFNTSILFLFSNAEFLAMVVLIVYIGAVAVLFLFVIMMLDINIAKLRQTFLNYLPIGLLVGFIILLELIYIVSQSKLNFTQKISINNNNISNQMLDNTKTIGNILYTDYFLLFQISGIILLVAMIGAIFLTIRKREGAKKQNIYKQILKK